MLINCSIRNLSAILVTVAGLNLSGCGHSGPQVDYSSLGLCSVTGKITLDGKPIGGVTVTMTPQGSFSGSFGRTDENGFYRMMYNSEQAGVIEGQKIVRLSTAISGPEQAPGVEKIPVRFNRKSELVAQIPKGGSVQLNYDLESGSKIEQSVNLKDEDR